MISLRSAIQQNDESKRSDELRELAAKEYAQLVRTAGEYVIDFDPRQTVEFRAHMGKLQSLAEKVSKPQDYFDVHASFRGELRRYRDWAADEIVKMRGQIASAEVAMQKVAESMTSSGGDLELQMNAEIERLQKASASNDLSVIQDGIREATTGLAESYEQLKNSNHMTIAQLQDEIRALHKEVADERRALLTDKQSGAWTRNKLDSRMEDLLRQNEPFWVLFLKWEMKTEIEDHPDATSQAMHAMVHRLERLLGKDALIGRWGPGLFATIVELDPVTEEEISKEVRAKLSGMYSIQEDGLNVSICVNVQTASACCPRGMKFMDFLPKLGQVTSALG